jgi:carbamoyl-phosphate synthase large subunit
MKVLVTGAGAVLGQGIIKCLKLAETKYNIIAVDPGPEAVGLYWADKSYMVPLVSDPAYLESILDILVVENPDILLVGTDVELMIFSQNKTEIESKFDTHVVVNIPDVIRIADDKWLTYKFLKENGFPYPNSCLPETLDTFKKDNKFPLVVKPRTGARSVGVQYVQNEDELDHAIKSTKLPIIQEYLAAEGDEFTSGIIMMNGCVNSIVTMRRDFNHAS